MSSDSALEKKYMLLKKRLDALSYAQPFQIESCLLVEKLLNDLVKTTEGFQQLKKQLEEAKINSSKYEQLLAPLKRENQRLVTENNQLHMSMIQTKEECEQRDNKWRTQVRMLESERNDWKFILGQKNTQEKKLQEELIQLKSQKKNENSSNSANGVDQKFNLNVEMRKWMDQVQESERRQKTITKKNILRMIEMKDLVREADQSKVVLQEQGRHYEIQIENRDREIQRLKQKTENGQVNLDKLAQEYQLQDQTNKASRLQTQIELLTDENSRLTCEIDNLRNEIVKLQKGKKFMSPQKPNSSAKKIDPKTSKKLEDDLEQKNQQIERLLFENQEAAVNLRDLTRRIEQLQKENNELNPKLAKAEQQLEMLQTDKVMYSKTMNSLMNEKDSSSEQIRSLQQKNLQLVAQLQDVDEKISSALNHANQCQREKEIVERNQKRLTDEWEREKTLVESLRDERRIIEKELEGEKQVVRELKSEFERLEVQRSNLDQMLQKLKQDSYQYKNSADTTNLSKQKLEQTVEGLKRENELLIREQQTIEELLRSTKRDYSEKEKEVQDLKFKIRQLNDQQVEQSQRLSQTQAQLQIKSQELGRMEIEHGENQRELAKYRLDQRNQEDSRIRVERDQLTMMKELESRNSHLQQEVSQQRLDRIEKDEKLKQLQELLSQSRLENERLNQAIREFSEHNTSIQQNIMKAKDKEGEYVVLIGELERVRESERRLIVEKERMQIETKKYESLISQGNKQIELINRQKEELMREVRDLRNSISQLKSSDNDSKNTSIKLSEKLNGYEVAIQDLKELYQREQQKNQKLNQGVGDDKQQISALSQKVQDQENQIKQLRALSEGLERTREELIVRLQGKNSERVDEEKIIQSLRESGFQMEEKIKQLTEELLQSRRAVQSIDMERDEMQQQLDEQTEQNVQLLNQIKKLENEIQKQQSKLIELQSKDDRGYQSAQEMEERLRESGFRIQKQQNEIENLRYTLQMKEKDLMDMKSDVQILSRENQQLNGQVVKLSQERELTMQQSGFQQQQDLKLKEQLRLSELEMRDLQQNYVEVCNENQRLSQTIQQISGQHEQFSMKVMEMEKEEDFYRISLQQGQKREEQMINQMQGMDREIERLNRRCEEVDRQLREVARERDSMMKDLNSQRRLQVGYQTSQEEINRSANVMEREKMMLLEEQKQLRRELDKRDVQLEWEQKRSNEMEQVLLREREQQMHSMQELQALRNQNEQLLMEFEKIQIRCFYIQFKFIENNKSDLGISRVSGPEPQFLDQIDLKNREMMEILNELKQVKDENMELRYRLSGGGGSKQLNEQSSYISQPQQSGDKLQENSRMESSAGWERLRMESENFKKSLTQAAISSQYLKMKMKSLQKEYEGVIPK